MAGTLDSLFGGIKSVQRGLATHNGGVTNVTINAVDMSKTVVIASPYASSNSVQSIPQTELISSTALRITSTAGTTSFVAWQVVESY
jgi:hypothetical protein